jgi:hypothetical protein
MDLKYFLKFSFKVKMIFRCSGIPVFRHSGVPAFRCSGIPSFTTCRVSCTHMHAFKMASCVTLLLYYKVVFLDFCLEYKHNNGMTLSPKV